uniref:Uncharacterized protein n=1 Tax=Plesiomonas shigelloides TaxID=703 RepID=A0A4D6U7C2_PLESH|nr:hypothetical protein [Plesiomonas shigelloides]
MIQSSSQTNFMKKKNHFITKPPNATNIGEAKALTPKLRE